MVKLIISGGLILMVGFGVYWAEAHAGTAKLPAADSIIQKSMKAKYADHEISTYSIDLIGKNGEKGNRKMNVWFKRQGEKQLKLTIKFTAPANIRGTGILSHFNGSSDVKQWLYLPVIKKARQISGGNSSESFLGTDFTMGDLTFNNEAQFNYVTTGKASCGKFLCYVLVGQVKSESSSDSLYSKKIMYIRTDNYLNIKTEFFDKSGQKEKLMTLEGVRKDKSGNWLPEKIVMKNLQTGHKTVMKYESRDIVSMPPKKVFTKRFLEKL